MKKLEHTKPEFWEELYTANDIDWDLSGSSPPFRELITNLNLENKKVFVPGCGNGYDVIELAKNGAEVWAIDFAKKPLENLKQHPDFNKTKIHLILSDIFEISNFFYNKFDYVFEYTCFCAIDPSQRKKYRDLIHQILLNGGKFISLFFPILKPETDDGPPFGVNLKNTLKMFEQKFEIMQINKSINSHPKRVGNEILVVMKKNG